MQADRDKWNRIFREKTASTPIDKIAAPPAFTHRYLDALPPGSTLDVACGDGCLSLYLANKGHTVTALDISAEALRRLHLRAQHLSLFIQTIEADLDTFEGLGDTPPFDNVSLLRFKPAPHHWPLLVSLLKPGGHLFIATFNHSHHLKTGFNARYCLTPHALRNCHPELGIEVYQTHDETDQSMDVYLFKRKD